MGKIGHEGILGNIYIFWIRKESFQGRHKMKRFFFFGLGMSLFGIYMTCGDFLGRKKYFLDIYGLES